MVAYYQKVMQSGETVRYLGRLHWIIYRKSLLSILAGAVCGVMYAGSAGQSQEHVWMTASLLLFVFALLAFVPAWFRRVTTEIVVTNKRIIYKRGWISRRTEEMAASKIETVEVNQSIPGRILGYGSVLIRGVGSTWEPLRGVASPIELRNAVIVE